MCDTPVTRKDVVERALFGDVLNKQLKENYAALKMQKEKDIFGKVVSGAIVKKYKLWRTQDSAISYKKLQKSKNQSLLPMKRTRLALILPEHMNTMQMFFKMTIILEWVQTFCRLRSFWMVTPKINERDTCLCIKHANMNLKLTALNCRKILCYNNHNKLLENTCCNRYDEQCLSLEFQRCVSKNPDYKEFDDRKPITLKKLIAEKQDYKDQSGHGKSAADSVGATCKRTADAIVAATGGDIDSLESFIDSVQKRCPAITMFAIDDDAINTMTNDIQKDAKKNEKFQCCSCKEECQHFNLGVMNYQVTKLHFEDVYTGSESEDETRVAHNSSDSNIIAETEISRPCDNINPDFENTAGPSTISQQQYNSGDYVLVKFTVRKTEYRYAATVPSLMLDAHVTSNTWLF
ncbi:hypothetical protein FQA39_LY03809 [Lamprigera yunnana]|nr:hypothetical protein FQA39_LY03809 [Lamprigera yunnana]